MRRAIPGAEVAFEGAQPILPVRDVGASVAHYMEVLGFGLDFEEPGIIASVRRGAAALFLVQGDQGHPGTWVWVGVGDVDALHAAYRAAGARIRHPPTDFPWAREMQVEDPDGNVLRMGSEPRRGVPVGPWRDMRGQLWAAVPGGAWERAAPGAAVREAPSTGTDAGGPRQGGPIPVPPVQPKGASSGNALGLARHAP